LTALVIFRFTSAVARIPAVAIRLATSVFPARRVAENLVPFYAVQLGWRLAEGKSRFGTNIGAVPAKNAPAFVRDLLAAWKQSPDAPDFHRFVNNDGKKIAGEILARHQEVPSIASRKEFDLIEVDLANAREAQEAGSFYAVPKHFIEAGLVDAALTTVIAACARAAATTNPAENFAGASADVATLVASVRLLHESLDSSLRFKAPTI